MDSMRAPLRPLARAALLVVGGGLACSSAALRPVADGGDAAAREMAAPSDAPGTIDQGSGAPDADAPDVDAAPPDAPPTPPDAPLAPIFTGHHAYTVVSTVTYTDTGGGSAPAPGTHTFTLVLDADDGLALIGPTASAGEPTYSTSDNRTFRIADRVVFDLGFACFSSLAYEAMTFTLSPAGHLTGSATGKLDYGYTDVGMSADATMTFDGVPDIQPPALTVARGADATDPFVPVSLVATEPLPVGTVPTLVSGSGESFMLTQPARAVPAHALSRFSMPAVLLRFGEPYHVVVDGIADFAGNKATSVLQFTTRAPPPLVAEDGLESVTSSTLSGALVIAGNTSPVIAGNKSLYLPPSSSTIQGTSAQLTLGLAVKPGDTVIRFSYRTVAASTFSTGAAPFFGVASVGKPITWQRLTASNDPKTSFKMPDQTTVLLGPVNLAELPLPAGTSDEVFLDRLGQSYGCGLPPPPLDGIIIDDLRVE
jgi:hypothetical protein